MKVCVSPPMQDANDALGATRGVECALAVVSAQKQIAAKRRNMKDTHIWRTYGPASLRDYMITTGNNKEKLDRVERQHAYDWSNKVLV